MLRKYSILVERTSMLTKKVSFFFPNFVGKKLVFPSLFLLVICSLISINILCNVFFVRVYTATYKTNLWFQLVNTTEVVIHYCKFQILLYWLAMIKTKQLRFYDNFKISKSSTHFLKNENFFRPFRVTKVNPWFVCDKQLEKEIINQI